ncbi:hypothetical protein HMPREF1141_0172 [Clostridium sp. MSTE9]|nr:hypothetical protein HMPREF1141_0172 [Clostridium sp. MSTE9]
MLSRLSAGIFRALSLARRADLTAVLICRFTEGRFPARWFSLHFAKIKLIF